MKISLVLLLIAGTIVVAATSEVTTTSRPDLTGHILTQDGSPLSRATIFIYTAGPKVGRGTL